MEDIKKLDDLYISIQKKIFRSNKASIFLKNREEIQKELLERSKYLENFYLNPVILQRIWFVYVDSEIKFCECGLPKSWRDFTKGYNKTCGNKECVSNRVVNSLKEHCLEKYGVDHLFKTEKFKQDLKKKMNEKYGVDNVFSSKEILQKIKETNLKKFGVTSWLKLEENKKRIADKISEDKRKKRDQKIYDFKIPIEVKEFIAAETVTITCFECNKESQFSNSYFNKKIALGKNPCLNCNPILWASSKGENDLYEFIKSIYTGKIIKNDRSILNGKEIDILLPDLKLAFEFNGIYFHSELFVDEKKVLFKKNSLIEKGISLIYVWEDDWEYKREIVKSRISDLLILDKKIFARKCHIKEISGKEEKKFLLENHVQGYVPSQIKLALFEGDSIVSLMTFGGYRKSLGKNKIEGEYELLRFCNKLNTTIVGGASKLFKRFLEMYSPKKVISYQNNSWHTGNLYLNLGFTYKGKTSPNYHWAKNNIRYNRFNFRKDKLVKEGFDKNKTESEIMMERGFFKVWDLGNLKWEYTKKT